MSECAICGVKHKEGTKVLRRHQKMLRQLKQGKLPCEIRGLFCRPSLCSFNLNTPEPTLEHPNTEIGEDGICNHRLAIVLGLRYKKE